jgi:hypothetical protein
MLPEVGLITKTLSTAVVKQRKETVVNFQLWDANFLSTV